MKITICIGSSCHIKGSRQVVEQLQALVSEKGLMDRIELAGTFCIGQCQSGVNVMIDGHPAGHFFLQPCSCSNTAETVACVMQHPKWRLSLQTHKLIEIK